jgi:hypothetical protein
MGSSSDGRAGFYVDPVGRALAANTDSDRGRASGRVPDGPDARVEQDATTRRAPRHRPEPGERQAGLDLEE